MKHIIGSLFFLIVLLCLSVFIFDPSKLYFELPWLDIPMHVLGGFGVASFVMSTATYGKQKLSIVHVLILYLCVAVTWELYELVKDVFASNVPWNGWSDTLSDTINGAVGAVVAFFILKNN